MSTKVISGIVAVVVVAAGLFFLMGRRDSGYQAAQLPLVTPVSGPITAAMVAEHNSATSCWTIIDGNVYDLTGWIPQHPGGERAILGLCGHDGTRAFHGQHDDAKRQADILATFKIGTLMQ